jgi:hypothetical protein
MLIVFGLKNIASMQLLALFYCNLIMHLYVPIKPLAGVWLNRLSIVDEFLSGLVCLFMFLFTDVVDDVDA